MVDFTESFNGISGPLDTAGTNLTWTIVETDAWEIIGAAIGTEASPRGDARGLTGYARAEHDTATADQYAEFAVNALAGNTSQGGPCVRFDPAGNNNYMAMVDVGAAAVLLRRTDAGARTTLATSPTVDLTGLPKILRVEVEGSTIRGFWNGVEVVSVTDTTYATQTRAGLYGHEHTNQGLGFVIDNFAFGDLAAGPANVTLTPAIIDVAATALDPEPQPVTVNLTPAIVDVVATPLGPVPQPVTVALTPATVVVVGIALDPVPQPVTVNLIPAAVTVTAPPLDPVPQPVTVALTPAQVTVTAVALDVGGAAAVTLTAVVMAAVAVVLDPQGVGPSAVDLTPTVTTLTAVVLDPQGVGPSAVNLTPAPVTVTAVALDPVPQPVTLDLTPGVTVVAGVALDPQPGPVTMTLPPASVAVVAVPLILVPIVTPPERTLTVPAVSRTTVIPGSRAVSVPADARVTTVETESRTVTPAATRALEVTR